MKTLSIIIPAYNEEKTAAEAVKKVCAAKTPGFEKEVIVVNDGSTDGTMDALRPLTSKLPFTLLSHSTNRGKGAAIRTGVKRATGDAILIQDADLELTPDDYVILLDAFSEKNPVVYGSRNLLPQNSKNRKIAYSIGGKTLTAIFNLLYGTKLTDINTAYKLFRSDIIKKIELRGDGFEFCEEITAKITRKGYSIKEVPIRYFPRDFSEGKKLRIKDGVIGLWTILRYRFWT
jgi:glycosyltransferase involved in cell wall biosynthesis